MAVDKQGIVRDRVVRLVDEVSERVREHLDRVNLLKSKAEALTAKKAHPRRAILNALLVMLRKHRRTNVVLVHKITAIRERVNSMLEQAEAGNTVSADFATLKIALELQIETYKMANRQLDFLAKQFDDALQG